MQIFLSIDPFLDKPTPSAMPDWDARRRFGVFFVGVSGLLWPVLGSSCPEAHCYSMVAMPLPYEPISAQKSCHLAIPRRFPRISASRWIPLTGLPWLLATPRRFPGASISHQVFRTNLPVAPNHTPTLSSGTHGPPSPTWICPKRPAVPRRFPGESVPR